MASKYRRVTWKSRLTSEGHTSSPIKETVIKEGWFHCFCNDGKDMLIERDDGTMMTLNWRCGTFITPPNVDMKSVCGTCGQVMEMKNAGSGHRFLHLACVNSKCLEYREV